MCNTLKGPNIDFFILMSLKKIILQQCSSLKKVLLQFPFVGTIFGALQGKEMATQPLPPSMWRWRQWRCSHGTTPSNIEGREEKVLGFKIFLKNFN
jgi:hypothetical protein